MPNTLNVSFNGVNSEALMLAARPFCAVSNGSACNSDSYRPSYVLSAMGLPLDRIESAIRISWGMNNEDLDIFVTVLCKMKNSSMLKCQSRSLCLNGCLKKLKKQVRCAKISGLL